MTAADRPPTFETIETVLIADGARTECVPTGDPYAPRWFLYRGDGSVAADTANGDLIDRVVSEPWTDHPSPTVGYAVKRRCREGVSSVTIATNCRRCGQGFEADRRAILAGDWRLCPGCRNQNGAGDPNDAANGAGRCEGCGRPLRAGKRTVCARCLGVSAS